MKVLFMIWVFVKFMSLQHLTRSVNCQQQQQPSSSYTRVLKNKRFDHSDTSHHDEVMHFTKCLALCNLKHNCDSVNYHGGMMKCIVYNDVTEDMKKDEDRMLEEDGWMYYEKNKQNMDHQIKTIPDGMKEECIGHPFQKSSWLLSFNVSIANLTTQIQQSTTGRTKIFQIVSSDGMHELITIYAQTNENNLNNNFDMYVFTGSHHNIVNFTKGLENNTEITVEQTEMSDGSSYLTLMVHNFIKARIISVGSLRMFTVRPEKSGYLVDQLKFTENFPLVDMISGRLYDTIPVLPKTWYVEAHINILGTISGTVSVIHFTTSSDSGAYGTRIPGIWLYATAILFIADTDGASDNFVKAYPASHVPGTTHHVRVEQVFDLAKSKYMVRFYLNRLLQDEMENSQPTEFPNVKVYTCDEWHDSCNGKVVLRGFKYGPLADDSQTIISS